MQLAKHVEAISDDFQSTFTIVDASTLTNLLGHPGDFARLTDVIRNYIPGAIVTFSKTNCMPDAYDIYLIRVTV